MEYGEHVRKGKRAHIIQQEEQVVLKYQQEMNISEIYPLWEISRRVYK